MTTSRLSTLCSFFADESRLLVVATAQKQASVDHALAWGLAYRGDRELSLLLPRALAEPTLLRVPWLVPAIRVFTYEDNRVAEPAPHSQETSIDAYKNWVGVVPAQLGDKQEWIRGLLEWLATVPQIEQIERNSYVAWHIRGRQVLKVVASKDALSITAGVDAQGDFLGKTAVKKRLAGPADDGLVLELIAATALAAADRLRGVDTGHREHLLQAALQPSTIGLERWRREFPAWRPGSTRSAFIDFLGTDRTGRVHVVETKVGPDTMLVLQGLDYWLWARANCRKACLELDTTNDSVPFIDFVVAPVVEGGELLSPYVPAQAEALHRTVPWRFFALADSAHPALWGPPPELFDLPSSAKRINGQAARWAVRLREHATRSAIAGGPQLKSGNTHRDPRANVTAVAREAYDDLSRRGALHSHVGHVMSSQAFALNVLAPLTLAAWTALARHHLGDDTCVVTGPPEFEYVDPVDELGEATGASPHVTQTDCLVRVSLQDGGTHLMLIEVKLSEDNFSTCSAFQSPRNTRAHICSQPGPFGGAATECFQLCNHDREHRRRYDVALGLPDSPTDGFGCWFRDGANQVMRNVALARILMRRGEAVSASMLLLAPDDHVTIWEQWHRHISTLTGVAGVRFADLPASQIAALHGADNDQLLSDRYLLPNGLVGLRRAQHHSDNRFPHGAALVRRHGDGTVNYVQAIERLVVTEATPTHVKIEQQYPAGPITYVVPIEAWHQSGVLELPAEHGTASFSTDLAILDADLQHELPLLAHENQRRAPWWTATASRL